MRDIKTAHIRRIDMTLLIVFVELMKHRKLTVVADRLGLTQSAISHSLKRLRDIFQDELFLRRPDGVKPTSHAIALQPKIAAIVELAMDAIEAGRNFDPKIEQRDIVISAVDNVASIFTARIVDHFRESAPSMRIAFRPITRNEALHEVRDGTVDIALGYFRSTGSEFETMTLFKEGYSAVVRKRNPIARVALTLNRYIACDHLLVSIGGDFNGIVDLTLAAQGLSRRVVAAVPMFLQALATVAETDLICTVPARLAEYHAKRFGLVVMKVPLTIRPFTISAVWHRRSSTDPALKWVRQEIASIVG